MEGENKLAPFEYFQRLIPLPEAATPSHGVAGTAGSHQGKKKGDPSSEPGVLTLILPPTPPPLGSQPPPPRLQEAGATGSLAQSHIGQPWWRGQMGTANL